MNNTRRPLAFLQSALSLTCEQAFVLGLIAESPRRINKASTASEWDSVRINEVYALERRGHVEVRSIGGIAVASITPDGLSVRRAGAQ